MDPPTMVVIASIVSTMSLFILVLVTGKLKLLTAMTRREKLHNMLPGLLNPFVYYLLLFWTYDILKAQEAQALNYTWPIILTLLSILVLKQRIGKISIAAIVISFIGVLTITTRGGFLSDGTVDPFGIVLGLSTAVVWSIYWIINLKSKGDGMVRLFLNFLFGTIAVTIFVIAGFGIHMEGWEGVAGAAYIGVFEMGVTFAIWLAALKLSSDTSKISNLIYLTPFFSLFLINWVVGERILLSTVIGLVLISIGILMQRWDDKRKRSSGSKGHEPGDGIEPS